MSLAIAIIAFSATDALAQKTIELDKSGEATLSATIKPWKLGDIKEVWSISGTKFSNLNIKQTNSGKFKYEIHRGGEFLSSGHTTGSNIKVESDGKSSYTISIINEEEESRSITLLFTSDGS